MYIAIGAGVGSLGVVILVVIIVVKVTHKKK